MRSKNYKNHIFGQGLITLLLFLLIDGIAIEFWGRISLASPGMQSAKVVRIIDGDSLIVSMKKCRIPLNGNPAQCIVQLACIDPPEKGEHPYFEKSKQRLDKLLPPGTGIMLRDPGTTALKNRVVAEVFTGNQSVNLQLVREGTAVILCKYLNNCGNSRSAFLSAEAAARKAGLGVWNPRQPWTQSRENNSCRS